MKKKKDLWQKGGKHYQYFKIQPSQFINEVLKTKEEHEKEKRLVAKRRKALPIF